MDDPLARVVAGRRISRPPPRRTPPLRVSRDRLSGAPFNISAHGAKIQDLEDLLWPLPSVIPQVEADAPSTNEALTDRSLMFCGLTKLEREGACTLHFVAGLKLGSSQGDVQLMTFLDNGFDCAESGRRLDGPVFLNAVLLQLSSSTWSSAHAGKRAKVFDTPYPLEVSLT